MSKTEHTDAASGASPSTDELERLRLLPCPFCGGEAKFRWSGGIMLAECQSCYTSRGCDDDVWGDKELKESAAGKWNMRPNAQAVGAASAAPTRAQS